MRFEIVAEAQAGLLCRLLGLIAQLDLDAPAMEVTVSGGEMRLWLEQRDLAGRLGLTVAEKMRRCVGVSAVRVLELQPG